MSSLLIEPEHVTAISGLRPRPENYALAFDRYLAVPRDRGYPFTLIDNHAACLDLDGTLIAISPAPWPQVCGIRGNAARSASGSMSLAAGMHRIQAKRTHTSGADNFARLWQGDHLPLSPIPASALTD